MGQNKNQIKFLRCKTKILTSKSNAIIPIRPNQIKEVIDNAEQHNISIVCLKEFVFTAPQTALWIKKLNHSTPV